MVHRLFWATIVGSRLDGVLTVMAIKTVHRSRVGMVVVVIFSQPILEVGGLEVHLFGAIVY